MEYDVIVIGVGSMGSSACYHLASRGVNVLGIEQFDITHELGSHTGQSRLIRKAYFEHPDYVPLLHKAYDGWRTLEQQSGQQFYWETGIAYFGKEDDAIMQGVQKSAQMYDLKLNKLNNTDVKDRWPQFNIPDDYQCLFEPEAGFITPERAIRTLVKMSQDLGAKIKTNEAVINWELHENGVTVITNKGEYRAAKVIFTAGAFTGNILDLKTDLKVTRQYLSWLNEEKQHSFQINDLPCWMISEPNAGGPYYGFPRMPDSHTGPRGMKIAHHKPGEIFNDSENSAAIASEEKLLNDVLDRYFDNVTARVATVKSCKYTYTQDEHFVIDILPQHDQRVIIGCGFSGHGFKFVPVVGEALADLALNGNSTLPISIFSLDRF